MIRLGKSEIKMSWCIIHHIIAKTQSSSLFCSLYNVKSISAMSQNMLTHIWLVLCKAELKKTVENHLWK